MTVAPLVAEQANKTYIQMKLLVVAYAMNISIAFDTMDNKYWKVAHPDSDVPGWNRRKDLVAQCELSSKKLDELLEK